VARAILITNPAAARTTHQSVKTVSDVFRRAGWQFDVQATTGPGSAKKIASHAVRDSVAVLRERGAVIRPVHLPKMEPVTEAALTILAAECAQAHEEWFPARADEYGPHLRETIEDGRSLTALDYARAQVMRETFRGQVAECFAEIDLLLCPPMFAPASPISAMATLPGKLRMFAPLMRFTAPWNLAGSPTITVPCGVTSDGLPLAFQLVARRFEEELLLRAGHAYESATDWPPPEPKTSMLSPQCGQGRKLMFSTTPAMR